MFIVYRKDISETFEYRVHHITILIITLPTILWRIYSPLRQAKFNAQTILINPFHKQDGLQIIRNTNPLKKIATRDLIQYNLKLQFMFKPQFSNIPQTEKISSYLIINYEKKTRSWAFVDTNNTIPVPPIKILGLQNHPNTKI